MGKQFASIPTRDMGVANGKRKRWDDLRGRKKQQRVADIVGTALHDEIVASAFQVEGDDEELQMV